MYRNSIIKHIPSASLVAILALGTTGCPDRGIARLDTEPTPVIVTDYPLSKKVELDILFVVDDSFSMEAEQRSLADNFPRFMEVLEGIEGGLPDVHIGVITTDVGTGPNSQYCDANGYDGSLLANASASCEVSPPDGNFIADAPDESGARITNYPPGQSLADTFSCIAQVGITGCAFEQPLESMRRALDGHNSLNQGFLRENAYLAVVFITDEDDCSASNTDLFGAAEDALDDEIGRRGSFRCWQRGVVCDPDDPHAEGEKSNCRVRDDSELVADVKEFVTFLKGLKFSEEQIIVAGIMGDSGPISVSRGEGDLLELDKSCGALAGDPYSGAVPATRLEAFLASFTHHTQTSICAEDLTGALGEVATELARVLDARCIPGTISDMDIAAEGIQPECSVTEILYPDTDMQEETVLPACSNTLDPENSDVLPCYVIAPDATCATEDSPTDLAIEVYPTDRSVPAGARLALQCRAEAVSPMDDGTDPVL